MAGAPFLPYFKLCVCIPASLAGCGASWNLEFGICWNKSQVCLYAWLKPRRVALQDPTISKPSILVSVQRMVHFEEMSRADSADLLHRMLAVGTDNSLTARFTDMSGNLMIF